jgi:hypothetical protein
MEEAMTTGFVILLIVVGVLALLAWPVCVLMARRSNRAASEARLDRRGEQLRAGWATQEPDYPAGTVVGGSHSGGGGRSVAPRRDEEVTPLAGDDLQGDIVQTPARKTQR